MRKHCWSGACWVCSARHGDTQAQRHSKPIYAKRHLKSDINALMS